MENTYLTYNGDIQKAIQDCGFAVWEIAKEMNDTSEQSLIDMIKYTPLTDRKKERIFEAIRRLQEENK